MAVPTFSYFLLYKKNILENKKTVLNNSSEFERFKWLFSLQTLEWKKKIEMSVYIKCSDLR